MPQIGKKGSRNKTKNAGAYAPGERENMEKYIKRRAKVNSAETSDKPASGVVGVWGKQKQMKLRPYKEWVAKFRHANGNNAQDKKVARTQAPGQPGRPEYNKGQLDTAKIEQNEARVLNNPKLKIRSYEDNSYNVSGVKSKTPDIWHKAYSAQKPPAMKSSVKSSGKPADVNKLLNKAYSKPKQSAK